MFLRKVKRDKSYTGVHYFESDSKQASVSWKHSDSPPHKKAKFFHSIGIGKVMCIILWGWYAVNSDYNSKVTSSYLYITLTYLCYVYG